MATKRKSRAKAKTVVLKTDSAVWNLCLRTVKAVKELYSHAIVVEKKFLKHGVPPPETLEVVTAPAPVAPKRNRQRPQRRRRS